MIEYNYSGENKERATIYDNLQLLNTWLTSTKEIQPIPEIFL
jgi:hypothetical protein